MLLALDTATDFASIALYDGQAVVAELNWLSPRRHTVSLAVQVDQLLKLAALAPQDLTALAVGIGPGSYTGTRIAISYAKGVAAALALPLVGVSSLDALVYPHLPAQWPVCGLVAAGRGRYDWALYAANSSQPQRISDYGLHKLPQLLPQLQPPLLFVGELSPADKASLTQAWGADAHIVSPARAVRRAGALAELAWQRLQAGDVDDQVTLSPIYLS